MSDSVRFEEFVRESSTALFRTAFLLTGNRGAADELVQDTLVRLYPKWDQVATADVPIAYVRRSIVNRYVSTSRTRASRDISVWELPDRWDGRNLAQAVEDRDLSWRLLGELPQRQRAAVVLRYFHDLPDDEIGQALGCREGTVRSLISRAISTMRLASVQDLLNGSEATR